MVFIKAEIALAVGSGALILFGLLAGSDAPKTEPVAVQIERLQDQIINHQEQLQELAREVSK